ncbi:hypothetical protein JCM10450v2_001561 [Rhodotorula kratochvilovae]
MPLRHLDLSLRALPRAASHAKALRPARLAAAVPAKFHDARGLLGQVWLPDMARIEAVQEPGVRIPSLPDSYTVSRLSAAPAAEAKGAFTTVASPATHLGGGPSSTGGAAK